MMNNNNRNNGPYMNPHTLPIQRKSKETFSQSDNSSGILIGNLIEINKREETSVHNHL